MFVRSTSNFNTNDMVLITGTDAANTNEYAVISAIPVIAGGTNLIFESALTNSHAANTAVMVIREFGGISVCDDGGSTNIFLKLTTPSAISATLQTILKYTK